MPHPGLLAAALGLAFVPWLTNSLRLWMWSRFVGFPLSLPVCLRVFLGSILASAVTPTATGGALFKWGLIVREGVPAETGVTLMTIDTVEDALFFAVALPLAFLFGAARLADRAALGQLLTRAGTGAGEALLIGAATLLALVFLVAAARRGWAGKQAGALAARMLGGLARTRADIGRVFSLIGREGKLLFAAGLALTAVQWTARYSVAALVILALGGPAEPLLFGAMQWLVFAVSSVVPTPGGIGAIEAAYLLLYAPFLGDGLLTASLGLWRLILFYLPIAVAALLFFLLERRAAKPERAGEDEHGPCRRSA